MFLSHEWLDITNRQKLRHNAALIQLPLGMEENMKGCIDLVKMEAIHFEGSQGYDVPN